LMLICAQAGQVEGLYTQHCGDDRVRWPLAVVVEFD